MFILFGLLIFALFNYGDKPTSCLIIGDNQYTITSYQLNDGSISYEFDNITYTTNADYLLYEGECND